MFRMRDAKGRCAGRQLNNLRAWHSTGNMAAHLFATLRGDPAVSVFSPLRRFCNGHVAEIWRKS